MLSGTDSDNEDDWEQVDVPLQDHQHFEITLNARDNTLKKRGGTTSHAERLVRIDCHKIHTVFLIANGWIRNRWINDELLHARLVSLTPLSLQDAFALIHKSRVPDQIQRGRLFEATITRLVDWWANSFFQVDLYGYIRSKTFDEVQSQFADLSSDALLDALEDSDDSQPIRSPKSLMKHALARGGSRDVSAQLFTALCRALGIPARLVVSLQSVPWQVGVGKPKYRVPDKGKGKEKVVVQGDDEDEDESEMEQVSVPQDVKGKGKAKEASFPGDGQALDGRSVKPGKAKAAPVIKLRKSKSKGRTLGSSSTPPRRQATPDPTLTAPVFWTEVFSRADTRWLPVDPVRNIVNKRKVFDPSPGPTDRTRQENRMVYVVAFEEDGYARDVTPRYAKDYGARVTKMQEVGGSRAGGRQRRQWWERVIGIVRRPYRLLRDDLEDDELQVNQLMEGMPTSMTGFKDHPLYVLARHLKRDEVIHPLTQLGKFRGEPVYARSAVLALKTAENWMRIGRKVKAGCQPMKWVKPRAATVNKRREIELALDRNRDAAGGEGPGEDVLQGLYAISQTELYKPDPVVNGKIPKNDFGNIDLYVPSMLPEGAVHLPFKGTAKIARKLGFDYAEAVTGFEFKKRRAFPVIEGVVVAAEHETILLEAYLEEEQEAEERARLKRHARAIKLWTRLVQGLRIRQRLQEEYAGKSDPTTAGMETKKDEPIDNIPQDNDSGGGFLIEADDVVQPFHLPSYQYQSLQPLSSVSAPVKPERSGMASAASSDLTPATNTYALETMDDDQDPHMEEEDTTVPLPTLANGFPKSMREMAEYAAQVQERRDSSEALDDGDDYLPVTPISSTSPTHVNARSAKPAPNGRAAPRPRRSVVARKRGRADSGDSHPPLQGRPPPAKRGKGTDTPTSTPASGRVLRPRASKSAAKIQEERAMEEAFQQAITE